MRAAITEETITDYITNLSKAIEGTPASNVFNCDETNVTDDSGRKKVIVKCGTKYPELIRNQTKSSTSTMICGNTAGDLLLPYIVYKASRTWTTWEENGPDGTKYGCTSSGWYDMCTFEN